MIYDTHCHLDLLIQKLGRERLSDLASQVDLINTIGTRLEDFSTVIDIANQFDNVYCSIGHHPLYVRNDLEILNSITTQILSHKEKIIAIGETGLDFFKTQDSSLIELQKKCFVDHINIGIKHNLPIIIHSRDAEQETIDILSNHKETYGVMHCFTGTEWMMKKALDLGFYISISGIVTFHNAENLRRLVGYIPLDRLLVETDAPYLSPEPFRKNICEPKYIKETINTVAKIKNISYNECEEITHKNGNSLFLECH